MLKLSNAPLTLKIDFTLFCFYLFIWFRDSNRGLCSSSSSSITFFIQGYSIQLQKLVSHETLIQI